jgi:hypothetical protein
MGAAGTSSARAQLGFGSEQQLPAAMPDCLPFFFFFFFLHAPRSTAAARGLEAGCSSSSAPSLHAFFHEHFQKHCIPLATCASSYASHAANFTPAVFVSPVHLDRIVPRRLVAVFNGHKRAECHVACDDG